jgi:ABC-2 type transport system permease protein
MLGLFLVSSTYMAIGLFISCLTNYQIVAGIITFLAFFVLEIAGGFFQHYDFIRDLTWFLQISGRTETMIAGLITTKDLFYFLLIIALFLGLAMIKLKSKHESKKWTVAAGRNLTLITLVLLLGYASSRPGYIGYLDVTRNKLNTIDPATQAVLKELDGSPVTVTLYTNLLGANLPFGVPGARNAYIQQFWSKYIRFYPNIELKYEYYYDIPKGDSMLYKAFKNKSIHHIAKQFARMSKNDLDLFQKPGEINKQVDLSREPMRLVMELKYKGKKTLLRTFDYIIWPPEPVVSASVMKLTRNLQPEVKFTAGHFERSPWRNGEREFGSHTNNTLMAPAMINNGMMADTVSFLHGSLADKPKLLVVADPKSALEKTEQDSILRFIDEGGNAMFYAEPGKQQMLNPVLSKIGVKLEDGRLLYNKHNTGNADHIRGSMTRAGAYLAKESAMHLYQLDPKYGISSFFPGAAVINYVDTNGFVIEPIFTLPGNKNAWIEKGYFQEDSAASVFEPEKGDIQRDEYVIGIKMTRQVNNREQRIVVMGDADFMTSGYSSGGAIGLGLYSWLTNNEYPVYTRIIEHKDVFLTIGRNTGKVLWYVFVYAIPGLLLIAGTIILIRRKRK